MKKILKNSIIIFLLLMILSMIACNIGESQTEINKAVVRNYAKEEDQGSKDFVDKYVDPDFVFHYPNGAQLKGIDKLKNSVKSFQSALPDGNHQIEDQLAEGDKVATRYTWTGTHKGIYMGIEPTGKQLKFTMLEICQIKNGKIIEGWIEFDPSVFNQLKE